MKPSLTRLPLLALFLTVTVWADSPKVDFQKVYEIDGMSAAEIRDAFGNPTIDVGMDVISKTQDVMNVSSGNSWVTGLEEVKTGKLRCNISVASWLPSVNEWVDADVVVQVRDGKARITVASLEVHGPGRTSCIKSVESHLDRRFALVKELGGNW